MAALLGAVPIATYVEMQKQSLDALVDPPEDGRDIALTHRARRIFTQLGLWERLPQDEIAPLLRCRVVVGAANNQLADRAALRRLLADFFGMDLAEAETLRVPAVPEWS